MMITNSGAPAQALRSLRISNSAFEQSSARLSSGVRLSSSKDGASSLAVANSLRNQIKGMERSAQNSANGISIVQIADGALSTIHDMIQRVRELSVYASTGTQSTQDRLIIQGEIDQIIEEIDVTARSSQYNRVNLLSGNASRMSDDLTNNSRVLNISDTLPSGVHDFIVTAPATPTTHTVDMDNLPISRSGNITINGVSIEFQGGESQLEVQSLIRESVNLAGFDFDFDTNTIISQQHGSRFILSFGGDNSLLAQLGLREEDMNPLNRGTDVQLTLNNTNDLLSDSSTLRSDGNRVTVTDINGRSMVFDVKSTAIEDDLIKIEVGNSPLIIQTGPNQNMELTITIPLINTRALNVDNLNVVTFDRAQEAIDKASYALDFISSARARVGAYQNRLDFNISNLDTSSINSQQALSRIVDTDMAAEMAEFSIQQTITQAAVSMLAQLNQRPQMILQLLQ